jgi:hypothetical protein
LHLYVESFRFPHLFAFVWGVSAYAPDSWEYQKILFWVPLGNQSHLTSLEEHVHLPERLLDVLESLYVDDSVTLDLRLHEHGCMQQPTETFEGKTLSNQKMCLSQFARVSSTASIYVRRFMPTHRVPCSGPIIMGALQNALRGLGIQRGARGCESIPLDLVHDVARTIDRKEAQFHLAQPHVGPIPV